VDPFVGGGATEFVIKTKHTIKLHLPTVPLTLTSAPRDARKTEPSKGPEAMKAKVQGGNAVDNNRAVASEDFKPIYYIPHPDEYVGRDSAFPNNVYVITKGEEVGLFAAW
jgi:hypothetical protein